MRIETADFFFQQPIDFEHKKWLLLSFIRDIKKDFSNYILYPTLDQITYQLQNLEKWKYTRELYFKKELKGIDFEKMTLIYDIPEDSKEIKEINQIVDYSIEELEPMYKFGSKIFRKIESNIKWERIGIIPNYKEEGYLILEVESDMSVYMYKRVFNEIVLSLIDKRTKNFYNTPEKIKLDLIFNKKDLPNPNTILAKSSQYPIDEAIIPIIKRNLASKIFI